MTKDSKQAALHPDSLAPPKLKQSLLEAQQISKQFAVKQGWFRAPLSLHALREIDLEIYPGETVALIGESGCGKTTLARALLQLATVNQGKVRFEKNVLSFLSADELRGIRKHFQIVYQDPSSALDPRLTVADIIAEGRRIHKMDYSRSEERIVIEALLDQVELSQEFADRYPQELSGGQRQRVNIARALAVEPTLLILDEPTAALDASVQAQVLNLLLDLKEKRGLSYLLITHDLRLVRAISDRSYVMYLGEVVECGPTESIFETPKHPYTEALLSSIPTHFNESLSEAIQLKGELPSPLKTIPGCLFNERCPKEQLAHCTSKHPQLLPPQAAHSKIHQKQNIHQSRCWLNEP